MKNLLEAFCICFSMYSKVPMPQINWKKENMKSVFCFFPLIGLLIGGIFVGWVHLAAWLELSAVLSGAVATVLPVLITGGIHMDGFADTCDAIFSYGDPEKKRQILKDPRSGAFAVIYTGVYFLLTFGLFVAFFEAPSHGWEIACGYILSRILSGLMMVFLAPASESGLAHLFSNSADRHGVRWVLLLMGLLLFGAGIWMSLPVTLTIAGILAIHTLIFVRFCRRQFGGLTGDLAGAYLQINELLLLAVCVLL